MKLRQFELSEEDLYKINYYIKFLILNTNPLINPPWVLNLLNPFQPTAPTRQNPQPALLGWGFGRLGYGLAPRYTGLPVTIPTEKDNGSCVSLDELCVSSDSLSGIAGGGDHR
jgi:hypothetical protein